MTVTRKIVPVSKVGGYFHWKWSLDKKMAKYWENLSERERFELLEQIRKQQMERQKQDFWGVTYFQDTGEKQDEKTDN